MRRAIVAWIVVQVDEGAQPDGDPTEELRAILREAADRARATAYGCPLRTQDPQTRRYVWHKVATGLRMAALYSATTPVVAATQLEEGR